MKRRVPSIKQRRSDRLSYITDRFITHKDKKINEQKQREQEYIQIMNIGNTESPLQSLDLPDTGEVVYNDTNGAYTWTTSTENALRQSFESYFKTPEPPAELFNRAEFMELHNAVNDVYNVLDRIDDEELRRSIMTLSERWTSVLRRVEPHFIKDKPREAVPENNTQSKGLWDLTQKTDTPQIDLRESDYHSFKFATPAIQIQTSKAGMEAIEKAFHEQYMKEYTEKSAQMKTSTAAEEWAEKNLKYNYEG